MASWLQNTSIPGVDLRALGDATAYADAEAVLQDLAKVFFENTSLLPGQAASALAPSKVSTELPNLEAKYRALVEQIPAVVFMAYLDECVGEAYVSPQIERVLGFTQEEWLQDPVRWYSQVHPDDKQRWSAEAAELFLTGKPLRSAYRILSRDKRVMWLHCEAKMIRREDGRPWFIHGVGFDITDLKLTEEALQEERNVVTAMLDTVGALIIVLDPDGRIVRFNRACERSTGKTLADVAGRVVWDLFIPDEDAETFRTQFEKMRDDQLHTDYECPWLAGDGTRRQIAWSGASLPGGQGTPAYVIATGIDITERKHLERAILEISAREQRRIGQDLHDGLGQHLTGIAFMSKVQEQKLKEKGLPYADDAAKIVKLVNEAINKTRELARGLSPVVSESHGLMTALQQLSAEVEDVFGVSCQLQCDTPVLIHDVSVATHLYHIARKPSATPSSMVRPARSRSGSPPATAAASLPFATTGSACKKDSRRQHRHGTSHHEPSGEDDRRNSRHSGLPSPRHSRDLRVSAHSTEVGHCNDGSGTCQSEGKGAAEEANLHRRRSSDRARGTDADDESRARLEVCGEAEEAATALQAITALRPDFLIIDISLNGPDGLDLLKSIRVRFPLLPVLVLSMHDESIYAERALRAGAHGYIMKQEATEKVLIAVRQILDDKVYVSDRIANRMLQNYISGASTEPNSPIAVLSDRELEVFRLIGDGHSTRKIADELHLSVKTVESYQAHIKDKLALKSGRELVQRAIQWSTRGGVA